ncbi:MAG: hypothetical protein EP298_04500 [Gammaproteobacteria bacterium]|nr:MAG: hypothetical protein EP298_04500 [Gammaproteobacteria bacterium]UTW42607.1 hypothetical protein KFE69_00210 [bacterium SCSIO 12844]
MGIEKLSWDECKHLIEAVNEPFYQLLAEYPGIETYTFEKYSYAYGQIISDENYFYNPDGKIASDNIPFSIFLSKNFEMFLKIDNFIMTKSVLSPGDLIFITSFLSKQYVPNAFSNISICAGTRTPILIGNFGNTAKYHEVSNYLNHNVVKYAANEDNFHLLREICMGYQSKWKAEFLAFPIELHQKIYQRVDNSSFKILNYIYSYFLDRESFSINSEYYNLILSHIKRFYSSMMNSSYINNIIVDIYKMACEYKPSYTLANDNESLPLDDLHFIFNEIYKADSAPFMMVPIIYSNFDKNSSYYFSIPVHTASYKPDKIINLTEFSIKIKNLFEVYKDSIDKLNFSEHTLFYRISQSLDLKIITDRVSTASKQNQVTLLKNITELDHNFNNQLLKFQQQGYNVSLPQRSKFFSGAFKLNL